MPRLLEVLDDESRTHFDEVLAGLTALGIAHEIDHGLVRGLDYYTRTAFEVHDRSLGAQSALGGGGRYDGLIEALGGPAHPRRRLLDRPRPRAADGGGARLRTRADRGRRLHRGDGGHAPGGADAGARAAAGLHGGVRLEGRAVNAQMRRRQERRARGHAVGDEEWQRGEVVLKDLRTGTQQTVSLEGIVEALGPPAAGETQGTEIP